tara:strand:+ start:5085 stop:6404 length:1320 start_codon:yes stop_codon:yes gene_type:complete
MTISVSEQTQVVIVGLGYVGLPLTLAFGEHFSCTGFDINSARVEGIKGGHDLHREVSSEQIKRSSVTFTTDPKCIRNADLVIVTVPTPITDDYEPDLNLLTSASKLIGMEFRKRTASETPPVVVFESTTYPGCTEDFCGPLIERESGLVSGDSFYLGYSPERTNFGDQEHSLDSVVKIISGQNSEVEQFIFDAYSKIATAGLHLAESIRVAESAKVIENIQRDLNIALFNELALIFEKMDIDSSAVFDAAATKWNFNRYAPGLVGGHCIPVDPYYLTHAAEQAGHTSKVVLAGRAVNEAMPAVLFEKIMALCTENGLTIETASILFLGATFKPDVSDLRNSKTLTLFGKLSGINSTTQLFEPNVNSEVIGKIVTQLVTETEVLNHRWDLVVIGVEHSKYSEELKDHLFGDKSRTELVVDIPGMLRDHDTISSPYLYWRL